MRKRFILIITVITLSFVILSCGHEHNFGAWIIEKEATCAENGEKYRLCECGEKEKEKIPNLGHTKNEWIIDLQPTCTDYGEKHRMCSLCNQIVESAYIVPKGHTEGEWVVEYDSACEKEGVKNQVCSECEEIINSTIISPKGHDYAPIECALCGEACFEICDYKIEYTDNNGLNVTVNSIEIFEQEGYYGYTIDYTIENKVADSKIMPGTFKLFLDDKTYENQYGGFDYLFYGESISRQYTWKVLKTQSVMCIEYNADDSDYGLEGSFFKKEPIKESLHWVVSDK